ncbi:hypothetical protein ACFFV7_24895 [Nonomuraea spiralis]|uniref:Uncharacterized protein n=1 Tax=Nonomuraea spiralis TaxID=46182 RepID=A0ABV5IIU3_9ACTN|nr:hypothetical protein GCM10010176_067290 [Nonomuraea spiralis]
MFKLPDLSKAQRTLVMYCWSPGAIPLVPQGIVAAGFVANGRLRHPWFLATYMEPGLRRPVATGMIILRPARSCIR